MANTIRQGNAGFKYTPSGGNETTHKIATPLRVITPATRTTRFKSTALDNTTIEIITISGSEVDEINATIRYEDDPAGLVDMLTEGANGITLEYFPDLSDTGTSYPSQLIEPQGELIELEPDEDFGKLGLRQITIRLRRVDGGNFDPLLNC